MKHPLPQPTAELVTAAGIEFDKDPSTQLGEEALKLLFTQFPRNTDISEVLLKALTLNKLYSARVRDIDVDPLARHIASLRIDPLLVEGSPSAVDVISKCDGLRQYFSFASKYCSWHNASAYPIYDSYSGSASGGTVDKTASSLIVVKATVTKILLAS